MGVEIRHGQACLDIPAAPAGEASRRVSTPWGDLTFQAEVMVMRGREGRDSDAFEVETSLGPAVGTLHLAFDTEGAPSLGMSLMAGSFRWASLVGEPLVRDGRRVGWSAWLSLGLKDSRPLRCDADRVSLVDPDVPQSEWHLALIPRSLDMPGLPEEVAAAVTTALDEAAARDPRYAARAYAAMMADIARDAAAEAEGARIAYLAACREVDRISSEARRAGDIADGHAPHGSWSDWGAPSTGLGEIRGFGSDGAEPPAYDPSDVDEIVVAGPSMVHLETMDDDATWMGIYLPDGRRVVVNMTVVKGRLVVAAEVEA